MLFMLKKKKDGNKLDCFVLTQVNMSIHIWVIRP